LPEDAGFERGADGVSRLRVEHIGVWVRDLEHMREFYVDRLGGQAGPLYENPQNGFRSYFISFDGDARIELMSRADRPDCVEPPVGGGHAHVAFALPGASAVDGIVERLGAAGVVVVGRPRTTGDGYYEAVVEDPEGNRIEFVGERRSPTDVSSTLRTR
jgi:lactoylglutathione lyase